MAISLYKHPNARKGEYCAICLDRTRGPATRVELAYGVSVHLCGDHAGPAFRRMRGGRDFALTLHRAWSASGSLTRRRTRALDAQVAALRPAPARRARPGSYAWPMLREEAERRDAAGDAHAAIVRDLGRRRDPRHSRAPSVRTIRRWLREQRWRTAAPARPALPAGPRGRHPLMPSPPPPPTVAAPRAAKDGARRPPQPGGT